MLVISSRALPRERMTHPRIALVVAGIAGMLLIVRPGSEIFRGAAALSLGSAVASALFQILTRKMAGEDSRVLLFYPALVGTLALTAALPWFRVEATLPWEMSRSSGYGVLGRWATSRHLGCSGRGVLPDPLLMTRLGHAALGVSALSGCRT